MIRSSIATMFAVVALATCAGFVGTATSSADPGAPASGQVVVESGIGPDGNLYKVVVNIGNNGKTACSNSLYISYDGGFTYTLVGTYVGGLVLIINQNNITQHCTMKLVDGSGPGVSDQLGLNFPGLNQVYTKSGNAQLDLQINPGNG